MTEKPVTTYPLAVERSETQIDLCTLAEQVRSHHAAVLKAGKDLVRSAIAAGNTLLKAKEQFARGDWLPWLRVRCDLHERTAHRYMALAKGAAKLGPGEIDKLVELSLSGAQRMIDGKAKVEVKVASPADPGDDLAKLVVERVVKVFNDKGQDAAFAAVERIVERLEEQRLFPARP